MAMRYLYKQGIPHVLLKLEDTLPHSISAATHRAHTSCMQWLSQQWTLNTTDLSKQAHCLPRVGDRRNRDVSALSVVRRAKAGAELPVAELPVAGSHNHGITDGDPGHAIPCVHLANRTSSGAV